MTLEYFHDRICDELSGAEDYIKYSNEEKLTIVQIEDIEAYEQLEEIAQVPGIDMIFFGPADFSQGNKSVGRPDSEVDRVRRLVAKTARKYGKFAGTVGSLANFDQLVDMGYTFVSMGADVVALTAYFKNISDNAQGRKIVAVDDIK